MTCLFLLSAILPGVILCAYTLKKDKGRKKHFKEIALLLFLGIIISFPASCIGCWIDMIIFNILGVPEETLETASAGVRYVANIFSHGLNPAFTEELLKFLALVLFVKIRDKKSMYKKSYDYIVYAVLISLGFAIIENIIYVIEDSTWTIVILRAVISVPMHMFAAVFMGYFYNLYKVTKTAENSENDYVNQQMIIKNGDGFNSKKYLCLSFVMAVLPHWAHNMFSGFWTVSLWWLVVSICLFVFLYKYCFRKIKEVAAKTDTIEKCAEKLLAQRYPESECLFVSTEVDNDLLTSGTY